MTAGPEKVGSLGPAIVVTAASFDNEGTDCRTPMLELPKILQGSAESANLAPLWADAPSPILNILSLSTPQHRKLIWLTEDLKQ